MQRRQVTAFIDWNAQLSNAKQKAEQQIERQIERTATFVVHRLSALLQDWDRSVDLFNVELRIYYGWHKGLTPTPPRRALEDMIARQEVPLAVGKARFDWQQPFGDVLLDAFAHRLHPRIRVHLPDTLRQPLDGGDAREKMVDAALICDLLCRARSEPDSLRIVMAEDDDVVPAVFVGERWAKERGGRTFIARTRESNGFLALDNLLWQL